MSIDHNLRRIHQQLRMILDASEKQVWTIEAADVYRLRIKEAAETALAYISEPAGEWLDVSTIYDISVHNLRVEMNSVTGEKRYIPLPKPVCPLPSFTKFAIPDFKEVEK